MTQRSTERPTEQPAQQPAQTRSTQQLAEQQRSSQQPTQHPERPAPRLRFDPTDGFSIAGEEYLILEQTSDGITLQKLDSSAVTITYTHTEIAALLTKPDTRLRRGRYSKFRPNKGPGASKKHQNGQTYLASLPDKTQSKALWRAHYCQVFLAAEKECEVTRTEASVLACLSTLTERVNEQSANAQLLGAAKHAGRKVAVRTPPCPRSLLGWVRDFERAGRSPLSQLRKARKDNTYARRYCPETVKYLNECLWEFLSCSKPSKRKIIRDTHDRFREENKIRATDGLPQLSTPSASEIARRIHRYHRFQVATGRNGAERAKKDMAIHAGGLIITHPLQRVELDEWKIDVFSLFNDAGMLDHVSMDNRPAYNIGRRWIYLAIDVATRCVVGFRLSASPSAVDAISTVSLITTDKTPIATAAGCECDWAFYGGVGSLVTDMGSAFIADSFRAAVSDLGINSVAPVAGVPKLRGHVERIFGIFASQLMPELTGRALSNPKEKGDYPSEAMAALTDDDLVLIFTRFIVDIYHNVPHSGLNGETPANAWKRLSREQGVTPPPDRVTWTSVFGLAGTRKIGPHGVRAFGIDYQCPELQEAYLQGISEPIQIRVNPHDITHITVLLTGEWYSAQAISKSVWGLCLQDWQTIVHGLRHRYKQEAQIMEDVVYRARKSIKHMNAEAVALRQLKPFTFTREDWERSERDLFMGLSIKPKHVIAPVQDAPEGLGLLGDVIPPDVISSNAPASGALTSGTPAPNDRASDTRSSGTRSSATPASTTSNGISPAQSSSDPGNDSSSLSNTDADKKTNKTWGFHND